MNKLKLCVTGIVGIVSVSLIALLASGCGDDDPTTHELVGTWDLEQMIMSFTIGGQTIIDTMTPDEDTISATIIVEDDNTFTSISDMQGQVDTIDGTWSTEGDSLILAPSDTTETITFQYNVSGNTLTMTGTMVMEIQGVQVPVTMIQTYGKQRLIGFISSCD